MGLIIALILPAPRIGTATILARAVTTDPIQPTTPIRPAIRGVTRGRTDITHPRLHTTQLRPLTMAIPGISGGLALGLRGREGHEAGGWRDCDLRRSMT